MPTIGFGCASLGSRVSAAVGRAAIESALDLGIRWFDVAPSYGDGRAETLLGAALGPRRNDVTICTKVGIRPPEVVALRRWLRPLARGGLRLAPGARRLVAAHRPAPRRQPLTPALIKASLRESLAALRTDRVDVLALHEPTFDEVANAEIIAVLEDIVRRGRARMAGVAGSLDIGKAAMVASPVYRVVQCADPHDASGRAALAALSAAGILTITHSVYGVGRALDTLRRRRANDAQLAAELVKLGVEGPPARIAADALLRRALATNARGVVLVSSFHSSHLARNVAAASASIDPRWAAVLDMGAEARR